MPNGLDSNPWLDIIQPSFKPICPGLVHCEVNLTRLAVRKESPSLVGTDVMQTRLCQAPYVITKGQHSSTFSEIIGEGRGSKPLRGTGNCLKLFILKI